MAERLLDLSQLRTFLAVARTGSFTKAAGDVWLTQSAVSRQMKDLERSLGTALFDRFGRGVHLTAAGRCLLEHAEATLRKAEDARRAVEEIEDGEAGELRLGATVTAANYLLPALLATYRREHPRVRLVLSPASTLRLLKQLRRNELDLAILGHVPRDPDLRMWGVIDDEVVLVSGPEHPLAGCRDVTPERVAAEDMILREPASDTRGMIDRWATGSGVVLRVLMDMW